MPELTLPPVGAGGAYGRRFTDDDLLGMLAACAAELGRTPGTKAFDKWAGHSWAQLLCARFATWAMACEECGLSPNPRPAHPRVGRALYSEDDHFRAYQRIRAVAGIGVGRAYGVTTRAWMQHARPGEPSARCVRNYYGGWSEFTGGMECRLFGEVSGV